MRTMLDLTQNRYSSQWRAENAESKLDLQKKLREARELGKSAYKMGIKKPPNNDARVVDLQIGVPLAWSTQIFKEWHKGWDEAAKEYLDKLDIG